MRPASADAAFPFPSVGPRRHDPAAVAQALTPLAADGLRLLVKSEECRRLSRDAYDYSPVLAARLAAAEAELVVSRYDQALAICRRIGQGDGMRSVHDSWGAEW